MTSYVKSGPLPLSKPSPLHGRSKHGLVLYSQHGSRPSHSPDTAHAQVLNLIEDAQERHRPLYMAFWDVQRAYDSVSKPARKLSWLRLGVPAWVATLLVELDIHGGVIPRSPLASRQLRRSSYHDFLSTQGDSTKLYYFTTLRGAGQGATHSPDNRKAFFDIALSALDQAEGLDALVGTPTGKDIETPDAGFVDDLKTCFSTPSGFQAKADIFSLCIRAIRSSAFKSTSANYTFALPILHPSRSQSTPTA